MIHDVTALERPVSVSSRPRVRPGVGRRAERGAALVEAALTLPLVFMLAFGMITGGIALGQKNAMDNAAREAGRFGSTLNVVNSDTNAWLDDVVDVAIAAATGELDAGTPGRYICVALVGTSDGTDGKRVIQNSTTTNGIGRCGPPAAPMDCPPATPCVQVELRRDASIDLIFSSQSLTLKSSGMSSYERN